MTDSLREQVARRLMQVAAKVVEEATFGGVTARGHVADAQFYAEADEVIRCMEWARRVGTGKPQTVLRSLTLPPEDWRP